jgi:hypothetical protein
MKKMLFALGCLLALSSAPVRAQDGPAVVVVRVLERPDKVRLTLARGGDKVEVLEFSGEVSAQGAETAAREYQRVLARLYEEGYVLQSTVPGSPGNSVSNAAITASTTLVFVRRPKA